MVKRVGCGKFRPGDKVHVEIRTTHKLGSKVYHNFDGTVKKCRNGVYYITKGKDWCFAVENEISRR